MATSVKLGIAGTVNLTHPARTDSGEDFIGAQVGAGLNGHRPSFLLVGIRTVYTTCVTYKDDLSSRKLESADSELGRSRSQ